MIKLCGLGPLIFFFPLTLSAQLTLRVVNWPANTPEPVDIYAAGSFNDWAEGNAEYQLSAGENNTWELSLDLAPGTYEYKFTRGSWSTVEGDAAGQFRPNRTVVYNGGEQVESLSIAGWEDLGGGGGNSTAADNVTILDEAFYLPQLDRTRRIWLYLPPDYESSSRRYPVLYMHDGQNLFDATTSFSGEWQVDETLNDLFANGDPGIIVVGIDNGGGERINEFTPYANPQYGGGRGDDYVDFIVETLKPHIDANFRTYSDADHTGIMGSSLGGLLSLYAAVKHPAVFGRAGVFSPSLWFTDDIYTFVETTGKQEPQRYFLLAGYGENSGNLSVTDDVLAMEQILLTAGFTADELERVFHTDGQHREWYWAREFGAAYQWLFAEAPNRVARFKGAPLRLWPVPTRDTLSIDLPVAGLTRAWLYDESGRSVGAQQLDGGRLDVRTLAAGLYWLRLRSGQQHWVGRFVKVE